MIGEREPHGKPPIPMGLLDRAVDYLLHSSIHVVTAIPVILSTLLFLGWALVARQIYGSVPPRRSTAAVGAIAAFVLGFSGVIQVLRREGPGVWFRSTVRGILPVISGTILAAVMWTASVLLLLLALATTE